MRLLWTSLVILAACGRDDADRAFLDDQVERVVEVELVAVGSDVRQGGDRLEGRAALRTSATAPGPVVAGACAREDEGWAGVGVGPVVVADGGDPLVMSWSPARRGYHGEAAARGRDLSWQPVTLRIPGAASWSVPETSAILFGDRPSVVHAADRPDGGRVIWWSGDYDPQQVSARVRTHGERWRCQSGPGQVTVPWWLAEDAEITLLATRTRVRLLPDRTLVIGRGTIEVSTSSGRIADRALDVERQRRDQRAIEERWRTLTRMKARSAAAS